MPALGSGWGPGPGLAAPTSSPGQEVAGPCMTGTLPLRHRDQNQGKGAGAGAALSKKANHSAHQVRPAHVGPAGSPAGDLVLLRVHHAGHSGHPDRVLHILHVSAQVGAPDGDTGASVHRPSQWSHLFQDKDCSLRPSTPGSTKGWPQPPRLGPPEPTAAHLPSKGSSEEGTPQHFHTPSR